MANNEEILQMIEVQGLQPFLRQVVETLRAMDGTGEAQILAEEIEDTLDWHWMEKVEPTRTNPWQNPDYTCHTASAVWAAGILGEAY